MNLFDAGAFYVVRVTEVEVARFRKRWPCSGLPEGAITFQFDRRNGDLIDVTEGVDGEAATALSHDAQAWGLKHLMPDYEPDEHGAPDSDD